MSAAAVAPLRDSSAPTRDWFDRPAVDVAADLLGMTLTSDTPQGRVTGRIVEVEAYQGPEDLAAHSARGETARNAVMFGPPGHLYVYLVYGLHLCANVVCGPGNKPEAVLLRAAEVTHGVELARRRRGDVPDHRLAAGPGNLGSRIWDHPIDERRRSVDRPGPTLPGDRHRRRWSAPRASGCRMPGAWVAAPFRFVIDHDPHRSRTLRPRRAPQPTRGPCARWSSRRWSSSSQR